MFDGQFFPGQLIQFSGGFVAPPVSGGGGYSFTMTAGEGIGGEVGYLESIFGSLADVSPVPGHAIVELYSQGGIVRCYLAGNATALIGTKTLWFDSVDYGLPQDIGVGSGWQYDSDGSTIGAADTTFGFWTSPAPGIVDLSVYSVEIK